MESSWWRPAFFSGQGCHRTSSHSSGSFRKLVRAPLLWVMITVYWALYWDHLFMYTTSCSWRRLPLSSVAHFLFCILLRSAQYVCHSKQSNFIPWITQPPSQWCNSFPRSVNATPPVTAAAASIFMVCSILGAPGTQNLSSSSAWIHEDSHLC